MRVKCIANKKADLPEDCLDPVPPGVEREEQFFLVVGKEYLVYGITLFRGYIWYYLCDEVYSSYPAWNPSPLFAVTDGQLSRYWKYGYSVNERLKKPHVIFAFKEWVDDPYFYDKLTDGEEAEVLLWKQYKDLMGSEFPDPSNPRKAKDMGDSWVMCENCDEVWSVSASDGTIKCPKCSTLQNNPIYAYPAYFFGSGYSPK
ncbi:MAG: hypothetical protein U0236_10705 [Nitrospira sp.]